MMTMRIAVRFIFCKSVTPTFDVIEMEDKPWTDFLHAESMDTRIDMVLKHLGTTREFLPGKIRELAWFPLDDHMELIKHYKPQA